MPLPGRSRTAGAARRIDGACATDLCRQVGIYTSANYQGRQARRSAGGAATKFEFDRYYPNRSGRGGGPQRVLATLLVIAGEQGSAKTVLSKMLRALVDPNVAPVRALPREERDLFIAANNGHVLAFDNLSALPPWLSDAFCWRASGGSFAVRQLYTDQDEVLFDAVRPIVLAPSAQALRKVAPPSVAQPAPNEQPQAVNRQSTEQAAAARLFHVGVDAPNQAIAWMMALAQMCRNFATSPLADRTDKLVVRLHGDRDAGHEIAARAAPPLNLFG
jgi:hypothetical protein